MYIPSAASVRVTFVFGGFCLLAFLANSSSSESDESDDESATAEGGTLGTVGSIGVAFGGGGRYFA